MHKFYHIVVFTLILEGVITGQARASSQTIDAATGAEQVFTTGYVQRVGAEEFHREETYGPAPAALEEGKERWRFHKGLRFSTAYDANVFNARTDPKDDLIHNYRPYMGFSRRGDFHYLETFYHLSYFDYVENSKQSNLTHLHTLKYEYKKNKWRLVFANQYKPEVSVATGERTELASASSDRVTTESDEAKMEVEYEMTPKTKLAAFYEYGLMRFSKKKSAQATGFGDQRHALTPKIVYALTPKTSVYASYRFEGVFTKDGEFSTRTALPLAGAKAQLAPKTTLDTSAGWKERDFLEYNQPTVDGWIYRASLSRKLTPKVTSTFSFVRDFNTDYVTTGTQSSKIDTTFYGLNVSYAFSRNLSLNAGAGYTLTHQKGLITQKDIENPTLTFTREDEDEQFEWDADLRWSPARDKNLSLAYKSTKKNSSFKDSEYDTHKVVGAAEFIF
ncbi:MAG: outer membrane beta-barrel protein [Candidatus Omnitrophica bacterium]|nr:outer membrane beta-barrel protein [Candidatus Omnitrophota bacterium]